MACLICSMPKSCQAIFLWFQNTHSVFPGPSGCIVFLNMGENNGCWFVVIKPFVKGSFCGARPARFCPRHRGRALNFGEIATEPPSWG